MEHEVDLKKQIIKSAESVKKKLKIMRDLKSDNDMMMESVLKPITDPLNQLALGKNDIQPLVSSPVLNKRKRKIATPPTKCFKKRSSVNKDTNQSNEEMYYSSNDSDNSEPNKTVVESDICSSEEESSSKNGRSEIEENLSFHSIGSPERPSYDPSWSTTSEAMENIPFGLRFERGKLFIGNARVTNKEHTIIIGRKTYTKTKGLMELLQKKMPDLSVITEDDKRMYKDILLDTNAHRRDYDPSKPVKSNKGMKYTAIIKPLFIKLNKNYSSVESIVQGSGMPIMKKLKPDVDFVYWDDPNELVDRLKLLWASRNAGNTGVENEIISIVEELQEYGVIK